MARQGGGPAIATIVDEGLGNASYLLDLGDGSAISIDPPRDVRALLRHVEDRGLRIRIVLDTHLHNDFVSGNLELAKLGATPVLPAEADAAFDHTAVRDGDELDGGGLTFRVLATPGHTPEHVSYLLLDGPRPLAVFSGGALLRGSVARTDLLGAELARTLGQALYASIHERLLTLPDEVVVHPTHGAGATFCAVGVPSDGEVSTTIGRERAGNELLRAASAEAFVDLLLADAPPFPAYFRRLRELNRNDRVVYGTDAPSLPRLTPEVLEAARRAGAQLVDVRTVDAFARGHIPGALSIELRPAFATWLGWLVEHGAPLVFLLEEDQDRSELVWQCRKIGFEDLRGELDGGMGAWTAQGRPQRSFPLVEELPDLSGRALVDVRHRREHEAGHHPAAVNVPLGELSASVESLPAEPLVVHCEHALRATTAASILERAGREDLTVVRGVPGVEG